MAVSGSRAVLSNDLKCLARGRKTREVIKAGCEVVVYLGYHELDFLLYQIDSDDAVALYAFLRIFPLLKRC